MTLKEKLLTLPTNPGCYLMKDSTGNIIYVGKAKNLKRRVNSYFNRTQKDLKTENLVKNIIDFDFIVTNTEQDCLILENNLIKKYKPRYNILLKDDKNFPYIKLWQKEEFPRLSITRKIVNDGSKYFGPYFAGVNAYELMEIANNAFGLKTCKQTFNKGGKARACLNYELGLCCAPCINNVTKQEYKKRVEDCIRFFNGDIAFVQDILKEKMEKAGENLNFEIAIKLREQIKSLERLKTKYLTQFVSVGDFDCINSYYDGINGVISVIIVRNGKMLGCESFNILGFNDEQECLHSFIMQYYSFNRIIPPEIYIQNEIEKSALEELLSEKRSGKVKIITAKIGDKKKLLELAKKNAGEYLAKSLSKEQNKNKRTILACERLKQILGLKSVPYKMECYDISHISGTNKVASMVVFINGEPAKNLYRKFIIKAVEGNNDFASLYEALSRRLKELNGKDISFSVKPNLIVIDGGKGQLSTTNGLIEKNNVDIDIISLAEREEEIFVPHNSQPFVLKRSDVALQLVQRIRDEAHRFAITFHRNKRSKTMVESELDEISGIGKQRKKILLKHFGNVENIKKASLLELESVKGITKNVAKKIFEKLGNKQK